MPPHPASPSQRRVQKPDRPVRPMGPCCNQARAWNADRPSDVPLAGQPRGVMRGQVCARKERSCCPPRTHSAKVGCQVGASSKVRRPTRARPMQSRARVFWHDTCGSIGTWGPRKQSSSRHVRGRWRMVARAASRGTALGAYGPWGLSMSNHRPQPQWAEGFLLLSTLRESYRKVTHVPSIGAPMLPVQGESAMQTVFGLALALGGALAWRVYPLQIGSPA